MSEEQTSHLNANSTNPLPIEELLKRHFDVMAAQLGQVETQLTARIDQVETQLTARIDKVETQLTARIDKVETQLTARIDKVETRLNTRIDQVETRIDQVETRLNTRIDQVETKVDGLGKDVRNLKMDTEGIKEHLFKLEERLRDYDDKVDAFIRESLFLKRQLREFQDSLQPKN